MQWRKPASGEPTTKGPKRPPLTYPSQIKEDTAYWLAWFTYVAHGAMVVSRDGQKFRVHTLDVKSGTLQLLHYHWAKAALECTRAHQAKHKHPMDRCLFLKAGGKMASFSESSFDFLYKVLSNNLIESRARFPKVWEGIPVHEFDQLSNLMQRLKQPLSTYEEAIAATQGKHEVYQRRLRENAVGWPSTEEWLDLLKSAPSCPTCGATSGRCVSKKTGHVVRRHKTRQPTNE